MIQPLHATLDDLYQVEGKAELIAGRIVHAMPSGFYPGLVARRITRCLEDYEAQTRVGVVVADGVGFAVPVLSSGRQSFGPDAAYYLGPLPANRMRFIEGPPTFAVEVRSENDYGPAAELDLAAKRADYFEAGTRVVWDVDPLAQTVAVYRATAPGQPQVLRPGDTADAEPAVPGWRLAVADLFR